MRRHGLTPREAEVARLLARGMTDRQVAEELFVAHATARRHVERVLGKLGLASRSALALHVLDAAKRDP
jgi:DNA-binding NarL/FixJ family response regulator